MDLNKFLIRAKISTYASEGAANERTLKDGGKELTYEEGDFRYRDRYYGFNPFAGEEIVWQRDKAIWSMNYYGKIVSDLVSASEVYAFLQKAMRQVREERPFRGPDTFKGGDFEYADESKGEIDGFIGTERILYRGEVVYMLRYHGGFVRSK